MERPRYETESHFGSAIGSNRHRTQAIEAGIDMTAAVLFTELAPYPPKTNGKVKRFIQTGRREWAYAQASAHSDHRAAELPR